MVSAIHRILGGANHDFSHASPNSPTMQWLGIQNMLEQAESDVLILLDCCAGASSSAEAGNGVTEVIAACGFETWAPGVSEHSFTRSLIDELQFWCGQLSNPVAMLHMRVLASMKHWKPRSSRTSNDERRKTPIHSLLTSQGCSKSIQLIPLRQPPPLLAELPASLAKEPSSESSGSHTASPGAEDSVDLDSSQSSTSHVWSDPSFVAPKVLISLALEEDQWLSPNAWAEWLANVPAKIKSASVEGVYRSYSTLVLLSIPVASWDMLPNDPAVSFIGFVRSDNLLSNAPLTEKLGQSSNVGQAQTSSMSRYSLRTQVPKTKEVKPNKTISSFSSGIVPKRVEHTYKDDEDSDASTGERFSTALVVFQDTNLIQILFSRPTRF